MSSTPPPQPRERHDGWTGARLARLGKVALPGDDAAAVSADFDACLARIGEGKGDKFSDSRNL
jgi:hypothetical protein